MARTLLSSFKEKSVYGLLIAFFLTGQKLNKEISPPSSAKNLSTVILNRGTENVTFKMGSYFPVSSVKVGSVNSNKSGFMDIANNSKADEEMTSNDTVLVSNETETDIFANETTPQYVLMSQPLLTLKETRSSLDGTLAPIPSDTNRSVRKVERFSGIANKRKHFSQNHKNETWESAISSFDIELESSPHFTDLTTQTESVATPQEQLNNSKRLATQYIATLPKLLTPTTFKFRSNVVETSSNLFAIAPSKSGNPARDFVQNTKANSSMEFQLNALMTSKNVSSPNLSKGLTSTFGASPTLTLKSPSPVMLESSTSRKSSVLVEKKVTGIKKTEQAPALNVALKKTRITALPFAAGSMPGVLNLDRLSQTEVKSSLVTNAVLEPFSSVGFPERLKLHSFARRTGSLLAISGKDAKLATISDIHLSLTAMLGEPSPRLTSYSLSSSPDSSVLQSPSALNTQPTALVVTLKDTQGMSPFAAGNGEKQVQVETMSIVEDFYLSLGLSSSKQSSAFGFKEMSLSSIETPIGIQENISPSFELNLKTQLQEERAGMSGKNDGSVRPSHVLLIEKHPSPKFVTTSAPTKRHLTNWAVQNARSKDPFPVQIERDQIPVETPRLKGLPELLDIGYKGFHSPSSIRNNHSHMAVQNVVEPFDQNLQSSLSVATQDAIDDASNLNGTTSLSNIHTKQVKSSSAIHPTLQHNVWLSAPYKQQKEGDKIPVMTATSEKLATLLNFSLASSSTDDIARPNLGQTTLVISSESPKYSKEQGEITSSSMESIILSNTTTSMELSSVTLTRSREAEQFNSQSYDTNRYKAASIQAEKLTQSSNRSVTVSKKTNPFHKMDDMTVTLESKDQTRQSNPFKGLPSFAPNPTAALRITVSSWMSPLYSVRIFPSTIQSFSQPHLTGFIKGKGTSSLSTSFNMTITSYKPSYTRQRAASISTSTRTEPPLMSFSDEWTTPIIGKSETVITKLGHPSSWHITHGHDTLVSLPIQLQPSVESIVKTSRTLHDVKNKITIKSAGNVGPVVPLHQRRDDSLPSDNVLNFLDSSKNINNNSTESLNQASLPSQLLEREAMSSASTISETTTSTARVKLSADKTRNGVVGTLAVTLHSLNASYLPHTKSLHSTPLKITSTIEIFKKVINNSSPLRPGVQDFQELANGTLFLPSVSVTSTPLERILKETLRKMKEKEKIVRNLASGIVSSPVFNLASRRIADILKNETGLLHSVSRLEKMLGNLQTHVLRATELHLGKSANVSLLYNETKNTESNTSELAKHVDSKLNGISSKLKRISSVLKALELKRSIQNRTVTDKSELSRREHVAKDNDMHNKLIGLLLNRFSRLETLIKTKQESVNNMTATVKSSKAEKINSQLRLLNTASLHAKTSESTIPRMGPGSHNKSVKEEFHQSKTMASLLSTSTPALSKSPLKGIPRSMTIDVSTHPKNLVVTPSAHATSWNNNTQVERSKEFTYVTFRGGLEAGVFTDRGKVESMETCVELCYNHLSCHVAFMVGKTCYSIQCFSQKTCEVLPVHTTVISTRVVYLKDRMLGLPYSVRSHPTASSLVRNSNFTIKNCARNITVLRNMTFLAGMSAGNYTDYGTVNSIQACSNICCSKRVCDAAFMILNNCFTIDCASDKACHAIPSKSNRVNTAIVYFRKTLSDKLIQPYQMKVSNSKRTRSCRLASGVLRGVTFSGGISAGNFTDHGSVDGFPSCVDRCCSLPYCDVAFMVEKNCYSVTCAENKKLCYPVEARLTKFKTFMALKENVYFENLALPGSENVSCVQNGNFQQGFAFQKGIKAGNFTAHGKVKNMNVCVERCCSTSCDAAVMIGNRCYSVVCPTAEDCKTVKPKRVNFTTVIAFVKRAKENVPDNEDYNPGNQFTKSILGGHCDVTDEQQNVNITGGWKAGKFLRLPDIGDMARCTEACCDYHGCGAAMFIEKFCYNLICFKARGCQLIGTKRSFMIDKFIAVRKNLGRVLPAYKKAQIRLLTQSREHIDHSSLMEDVISAIKVRNHPNNTQNKTKAHSILLDTSFNIKKDVLMFRKDEIPSPISLQSKSLQSWFSVPRTMFSSESSVVSLTGSLRIGKSTKSSTNSKRQLQRSVMANNVAHSISVTPMLSLLPDRSISTAPFAAGITRQAEFAEGEVPSISYGTPTLGSFTNRVDSLLFSLSSVSDNAKESDASQEPSGEFPFLSDYSLLNERKNQNRKRSYSCTHTFVFNNSTLRGGLQAGDVKNEGKVEGMEECVEICCKTAECNVAFLLTETCYILACTNKKSCEAIPVKDTGSKVNSKVAYVARSKTETQFIKKLISHHETIKGNDLHNYRTASNKSRHELPIVKQGSCIRSPILRDVRFKLGMRAGDFKSVGTVTGVDECVALCCKANACNAIFMLRSRCYLVSCSSEHDCQTVAAKSEFYKPTVVYLARNRIEAGYFLKLIPKELLNKIQADGTIDITSYKDEPAIRRSQLGRTGHADDTENNVTNSTLLSQRPYFSSRSPGTVNVSVATSPAPITTASRIQNEIMPSFNGLESAISSTLSFIISGLFRPELSPTKTNSLYEQKRSVSFQSLQQNSGTASSANDKATSTAEMGSNNLSKEHEPLLRSSIAKKTLVRTLQSSSFLPPVLEKTTKSISLSNISAVSLHTMIVSSALITSNLSSRRLSIYASSGTPENFTESISINARLKGKGSPPVKTAQTRLPKTATRFKNTTNHYYPTDLLETSATLQTWSYLSSPVIEGSFAVLTPKVPNSSLIVSGGTTVERRRRPTSISFHKGVITTKIKSSVVSSPHSLFKLDAVSSPSHLAKIQPEGVALSSVKFSMHKKHSLATTVANADASLFSMSEMASTQLSSRLTALSGTTAFLRSVTRISGMPRTANIEEISPIRLSSAKKLQSAFTNSESVRRYNIVDSLITPVKTSDDGISTEITRFEEHKRNFIFPYKSSIPLHPSSSVLLDSISRNGSFLSTKAFNATPSSSQTSLFSTTVLLRSVTLISEMPFPQTTNIEVLSPSKTSSIKNIDWKETFRSSELVRKYGIVDSPVTSEKTPDDGMSTEMTLFEESRHSFIVRLNLSTRLKSPWAASAVLVDSYLRNTNFLTTKAFDATPSSSLRNLFSTNIFLRSATWISGMSFLRTANIEEISPKKASSVNTVQSTFTNSELVRRSNIVGSTITPEKTSDDGISAEITLFEAHKQTFILPFKSSTLRELSWTTLDSNSRTTSFLTTMIFSASPASSQTSLFSTTRTLRSVTRISGMPSPRPTNIKELSPSKASSAKTIEWKETFTSSKLVRGYSVVGSPITPAKTVDDRKSNEITLFEDHKRDFTLPLKLSTPLHPAWDTSTVLLDSALRSTMAFNATPSSSLRSLSSTIVVLRSTTRISDVPFPRTTNIEEISPSKALSVKRVQSTFTNSESAPRYNIIGSPAMTSVKTSYDEISTEINLFEEHKRNFILTLKSSTLRDSSWNKLTTLLDSSKSRNTSFLKTKAYDATPSSRLRSLLNTTVFLRSVTRSSTSSHHRSDKLREDGGVSFGIGKIAITTKAAFPESRGTESPPRPLKANSSNTSSFLNPNFLTSLISATMTRDDSPACGTSAGKFLNSSNDRDHTGVEQSPFSLIQTFQLRPVHSTGHATSVTSTAPFTGLPSKQFLTNASVSFSHLLPARTLLSSFRLFPSPSSFLERNSLTVPPSSVISRQAKTGALENLLSSSKNVKTGLHVSDMKTVNKTMITFFHQNETSNTQVTPLLPAGSAANINSLRKFETGSNYDSRTGALRKTIGKTIVHRTLSLIAFPPTVKKGPTVFQLGYHSNKGNLTNHLPSDREKEKRVEIPDVKPFSGGFREQTDALEQPKSIGYQSLNKTSDSASLSEDVLKRIRVPTISSSENIPFSKSSHTQGNIVVNIKRKSSLAASLTHFQGTDQFAKHMKSESQPRSRLESKHLSSSSIATTNKSQIRGHLSSLSHYQQVSLSKMSLITPSPAFLPLWDKFTVSSPQEHAQPDIVSYPTPSNTHARTQGKTSTPSLFDTSASSVLTVEHTHSHLFNSEEITATKTNAETSQSSQVRTVSTRLAGVIGHNKEQDTFGYFSHLFKSIKDTLTKKNSNREIKFSVNGYKGVSNKTIVISEGVTASFPATPKLGFGTDEMHDLNSLSRSLFPGISNTDIVLASDMAGTGRLSMTASTSKSFPVTPTKSSQHTASVGLDISEAMRPLHWSSSLCEHSTINFNSTLRGGIQAGVLTEVGEVRSDAECINQCCLYKSCDVAFLILNRCFLVACKSKRLCESVPARTLAFRPRVVYKQNRVTMPKERNSKTTNKPFNVTSRKKEISSSPSLSYSGKKRATVVTDKVKNAKAGSLCIASITLQNASFRNGINSGFFKDEGTVISMEKCVELCCSRSNCTVAFMLVNRCFAVSCHNESSCRSIPARRSIFQPQLAYVRRNLVSFFITSTSSLETIPISPTKADLFASLTYVTSAETKRKIPQFHRSCRYGNKEKKVTLRGGINAGSFLDSGVVTNIEQCVTQCCHSTKCDVAFMIMRRCFLITCFSFHLCESVPARKIDYFTELVHVSREKTAVTRDLLASLVQPSSPSVKKRNNVERLVAPTWHPSSMLSTLNWRTSGSLNTLIGSKHLPLISPFIDSYMMFRSPNVPPAVPAKGALIESTIEPIKVNTREDVRLIQTLSMSTLRKSIRHSLEKTITPSSLRVKSLSSKSGWAEHDRKGTLRRKTFETEKAFVKDETCQSTIVYYNATMRGGIKAGIFRDQGSVQNMRKCIEQCCRWQFCSVAFMVLTRCYTIACYNEHLCDPVPARNLTFTPRIGFVSRIRRDQGNLTNTLENKTLPSNQPLTGVNASLTTMNSSFNQATENFAPSTTTKMAANLSSIEIRPSPAHSLFSKVFTESWESRHNCTSSEQRQNVTLRGGLNAGRFKDNGKVANAQQCVEFCCKERHCDLALMLLDNCFTVRCHNRHLCESVPAKTLKYRSRIIYLKKIPGGNSSNVKSTKTISLLDGALLAMADQNQSTVVETDVKSTPNGTGSFDSESLAQILMPSPSIINSNAELKHSIFDLRKWSSAERLINQNKITSIQERLNPTTIAFMSYNQIRVLPSLSSNKNDSMGLLSLLQTYASNHSEPRKSAFVEGMISRASSGPSKTLGDPSRRLTPHPSSCLKSPISYNVTLRNGIRSGYFRDQGRVENMSECIRQCCDFDTCDLAFMLKQRCYLVMCYTKTGCQAVKARQSLFRPRVAYVQRTNESQLRTFMDGQVEESRNSVKVIHFTPSSTLPVAVKTLNYSNKISNKTKGSYGKSINSKTLHTKGEYHKTKHKVHRGNSGKLTRHHKTKHVTKVPEQGTSVPKHVTGVAKHLSTVTGLKERKRRKPMKTRHGNARAIGVKDSSLTYNANTGQNIKRELDKKKDKWLSHSDLEKLFRLMKVNGTTGTKSSFPKKGKERITRKSKSHYMTDSKRRSEIVKGQLFDRSKTKSTNTVTFGKAKHKKTATASTVRTRKKQKLRQGKKSTVPSLPTKAPHAGISNCKTGQVEYNQTLLGGLSSGLFHEIGQVNDISTCSQHCCSSPICDLAFMVLQHCFLVTCSTSNPSMCDSTPALATSFNPMISRVSRNEDETVIQETVTIPKYKFSPSTASSTKISLQRPEILASVADNKTTSTSPSEIPTNLPTVAMRTSNGPTVNGDIDLVHNTKMTVAGCISSVTEHNVTLRGGLHAGKFTDAGLVNGSSTCTEFCCKEDTCDVAFYAFNRCFLVDCFDEYLCSFTPSLLPTFTPTVIHVYRHHSKPTPKPATTIPPVNIVMEEIEDETQTNVKAPRRENRSCAHSEVYQEVTLRMGYNAGNFTPRGKVNSTNECVRECCLQQGCDLIFMFLDNCYTVSCLSSFACEIVPARKSTFKPRVVYFIKNNSSSVIKPSDFNSSLYRLNSTGEGPVNLVHYKEVPLEQRSHSSDKKDMSKQSYITRQKDGELSNDTQTVVEEFVVFPSAKTTPHNVSKTTGNGSLNVLKHNAGNHSLVKNGVKNRTKSRTDKEIDVLINKLSHVTEENRHLESEIHFLMSKQDEIEQTNNISSDSTRGSFKGQKRRPRLRSKKGTAYMENDGKSRTRNKKAGSPVDSRATKRVVLVDTDRPPVYPPTDEHYIGEHSIQRIREKVHKATHVGSSREMRLRDKGLKSPVRMILKSKASEWSLRSENRHYGSGNPNETDSRFDVGVIDGLDGKNVPYGLDNKNRELGRIINLNPTMKTRKRPEKPALETLGSKVSDKAEMPHRNKDLDAFQSENRMEPGETMQQDWIDSESKTGDSTSSFNGTIVEKKPENQDHFQIERPLESSGIKAKVDTSFPGRNADHVESLHRQTDHVHGSTKAFNENGMNAKENEDRFITDVAKGGNEPLERELGGFYQQMPPRNRSRFRIDEQAKISNTRGHRLNLQNVRNREEEGLINLENEVNEHRKGKQEEIISVLEPNLHLDSQKEKKEKDFGNKGEVEFENAENDNKVQMKSSSLRRKTQFESQRQSKEEKESDLHMDSQHSEVKDVFDKEESKMIQPATNATRKPKSRFVTSEAYAAHLEGNLGATHPGEKELKIGLLQDHKSVSNDDDEDQQSFANGGKQVSVEKDDENIFPNSGGHHGRPTSIDRVQAETSHLRRRHDFEAIFDKINVIYNRLQDLMRLHDQEHNETAEHYSRRHEEHIPTPSVSSKSTIKVSTGKPTRGMTFGQPSGNKVTVVKQYVSDKTEGSGKLSRHHRDQLMDYVTRIYRRVQEIYNRNTKGSAPKKKHIHKTKKVNRKQEMGRKPIRKETRSSITKAVHQKRTRKNELVLKEMKLIYKKMKEMYRQEKISRKAAEDMAHREERQRQRSFIPTRSTEPATRLRDMRPIHEGVLPLNGRNGGEQNKSSQHSTRKYLSFLLCW